MSIDDAYKVEHVLAEGAGGSTEVVSLDGSGPFIRKRIPTRLARRGVWVTLFECGCDRLPQVRTTYEMPDEFVVVCDYVPGENLEQRIASCGRLGEEEARRLIVQLCEAADALHAHGIIHRDITPTNVIMAADGAHLIDLGIARFRVEGATRDTTQLGTWGFASPEQCGFAQTDARSDIYSLGRLLGYVLTGTRPDAPEYERLLADDAVVSPEMREIVRHASAMGPRDRYQSATELARALGMELVPSGVAPVAAVPVSGGADYASAAPSGALGWLYEWDGRVLRALQKPGRLKTLAFGLLLVLLLANAVALCFAMAQADLWPLGKAQDEANDDGASAADDADALAGAPASDARDDTGNAGDQGGTANPNGGFSTDADPSTQDASQVLELVESGWHVSSNGYVMFAVGIRNTSDMLTIDYPTVVATGRDASGAVVFSDELVFSMVEAGETRHFAGQVGNGTTPVTVDFDLRAPVDYAVREAAGRASFSVIGVSEVSGNIGMTSFVGEVTTEEFSDEDFIGGAQINLCVVLRDETGLPICGYSGFVECPGVGETTSFEVSAYNVPEHASFEVYANPW